MRLSRQRAARLLSPFARRYSATSRYLPCLRLLHLRPRGVTLTIRRGQMIAVPLRARTTAEADLVTFQIVKRPGMAGSPISRLLGDNREVRSPTEAITSRGDRRGHFSLCGSIRGSGRISSPAEVRIAIEEPPPRIELPSRIDFEPILRVRQRLARIVIRNAGGGVAQGRLTVSAPWQIDSDAIFRHGRHRGNAHGELSA
jgi:hypothetical protein